MACIPVPFSVPWSQEWSLSGPFTVLRRGGCTRLGALALGFDGSNSRGAGVVQHAIIGFFVVVTTIGAAEA